jgi:hypothetical protein
VRSFEIADCIPEDAGNIFASWKEEPSDVLVLSPINGSRDEKVFNYKLR